MHQQLHSAAHTLLSDLSPLWLQLGQRSHTSTSHESLSRPTLLQQPVASPPNDSPQMLQHPFLPSNLLPGIITTRTHSHKGARLQLRILLRDLRLRLLRISQMPDTHLDHLAPQRSLNTISGSILLLPDQHPLLERLRLYLHPWHSSKLIMGTHALNSSHRGRFIRQSTTSTPSSRSTTTGMSHSLYVRPQLTFTKGLFQV